MEFYSCRCVFLGVQEKKTDGCVCFTFSLSGLFQKPLLALMDPVHFKVQYNGRHSWKKKKITFKKFD